MTGSEAGSLIAAAGLVPLLCAANVWARRGGWVAWTAGVAIAGADLLHSPIARIRVDATDRPAEAAAAGLVGVALLAVAAAILTRRPWLLLLAAVAAAPARVPVHAAGEDANLLIPLYGVIAVAWAAEGWELLQGRGSVPQLGWVGRAAALLIGWSAVTLLWTADHRQGTIEMLFFLLPFGLLTARLGALRPVARDLRLALGVQVLLALVFAAVAFWQFAARDVFWNPKVIVGNEYASFFRVNSLFWDASVYGRFMAMTIVLLAAVAVYRGVTAPLIGLIAVLFAGLYVAYSQSSLLALAAGALVLGASVWPRRVTLAVVATGLVVGLGGLVVAANGNSAQSVSSDRSHLLDLGSRVIRDHPLAGAGVGGFARAAVASTRTPWRTAGAESHTTPVTVLAELGPIGLVAFVGLIAAAAWSGLRRPRDHVRMALLAAGAALVTSSVVYNAFLEDPATWIVLTLLAVLGAAVTAGDGDRPTTGSEPSPGSP